MAEEKTDYPDARKYYPEGVKCQNCGKKCFGIEAEPNHPLKICNDCAVPIEYSSDGEYVRDADGSVSYA